MTATVIIPTTGAAEVHEAIKSVLNQTYETKCYIVCDGPEYVYAVKNHIKQFESHPNYKNIIMCSLPINVGAKGFYGHRVYAAFTHLIDTEYVMYLDQDNWLADGHVKLCVETIERRNLDWCYSLRQIHDKSGKFVCFDDCESLGKWQSYQPTPTSPVIKTIATFHPAYLLRSPGQKAMVWRDFLTIEKELKL